MADEPLMIGADEASDILGVHRATVLRWAASGKLTVVYRGRGPNGAVALSRPQVVRLAQERLTQRESA